MHVGPWERSFKPCGKGRHHFMHGPHFDKHHSRFDRFWDHGHWHGPPKPGHQHHHGPPPFGHQYHHRFGPHRQHGFGHDHQHGFGNHHGFGSKYFDWLEVGPHHHFGPRFGHRRHGTCDNPGSPPNDCGRFKSRPYCHNATANTVLVQGIVVEKVLTRPKCICDV